MTPIDAQGITLYRSDLLNRYPEIVHGFSTRVGGVSEGPYSSLNLSSGTGDDRSRVLENRRRFCVVLGASPEKLSIPRQVLGARVARLDPTEIGGATRADADALVTDFDGVPTMTLSADCVLVLIFDPIRRVIGNVHSSRHGARGEIAARTVERMGIEFGSHPEDLVTAIGPSVGPCCYQVREDVFEEWRRAHGDEFLVSRDDRIVLDLWSATKAHLRRAGVRGENIDLAAVCTRCHPEHFYSYRRDGQKTGRFGAMILMK